MKQTYDKLHPAAMVLLVVLCASWGLQQISIKVAIAGITPVMQAGLRSVGAAVLVLLWMVLRGEKVLAKDGTLGWGIAVGLLFSVEFMLIYWGLKFTLASRSVIFLNTMPFFTTLGAHLLISAERMTLRHMTGLCCAFIGILVAFSESIGLPDARMLIGDSMLLAAAVIWAATTVLIKASPLSQIPPSRILLYQLVVSALFLPLCSLLMGESGIFNPTPLVVGCIIYQVAWVAFVTYLAWFWLISTYPASRVSAFVFLTPLFGVLEGALLLDEIVTIQLLIALVLVSIGIYIVNRPGGKRARNQVSQHPRGMRRTRPVDPPD
ncbi:MAG: DMT family transporter [Desulfobacteraceae bacterium]